ncbi:MAG: hypothetical protein R3B09_23885 [Nannocystaceae bacterium]
MITRLSLALMLVTAAACERGRLPSATPQEPATPEQDGVRLAPSVELPCSLEGGNSWVVDTVLRTAEPQPMRFASGDESATLVLGLGKEERWIEIDIGKTSRPQFGTGGSIGASRLAERGPLDFALADRWMYATSTWPDDSVIGVLLGDLRDAGFISLIDNHVGNVTPEVAIAPGHDGEWAVAWLRDSGILKWALHLALVRPDGSVRVERTLVEHLDDPKFALVRTPTGYALLCIRRHTRGRSALVATLMDDDGSPRKEVVLTTELTDRPRAVVDDRGIHVAFVLEHRKLGFTAIDFDGALLTPPVVVWQERLTESLATGDLFVHHGYAWLVGVSGDCSIDGLCSDRAQVFVLAISSEGRASRAIELDHGEDFSYDVAMGRIGEDLVVSWYPDADYPPPLRIATLRCRK